MFCSIIAQFTGSQLNMCSTFDALCEVNISTCTNTLLFLTAAARLLVNTN